MAHTFLGPEWFMGYDVVLEIVFAVITLMVSIYSFRIYRLTNKRSIRLYGFGFLFISIAYFMLLIANIAGFAVLSSSTLSPAMKLLEYMNANIIGMQLYIMLFTAGLITITYMSLGIKNEKLYALLLVPTLMVLGLSSNRFLLFHIVASFLLLYIVLYYHDCYKKNKNKNLLWTMFAFILLFLSMLVFVLSEGYVLFYVFGHFLELASYLIILIELIRVIKK